MFEEPYTLFAAFIGSTLLTMATHGTDQDMVQRMLTAPNYREVATLPRPQRRRWISRSRWRFLPSECFFRSIIPWSRAQRCLQPITRFLDITLFTKCRSVFRGLIIAGIFATMMGSTSAALNALATSFTKDFYLPYIRPDANDRQAIRAARISTAVFGILMIVVATAGGESPCSTTQS